jgi:gluconokinase
MRRPGKPMTTESRQQIVIVMGVAGSGKTTIGKALAAALGWAYGEGDTFHPPANVAKMANGTPLTDEDRWPWLDAIASWMADRIGEGRSAVVACSALKRAYRDRLRVAAPDLRLVFLEVPRDELESRVAERSEHFFPRALLGSQLAALEPPQPDERAIAIPAALAPARIVAEVIERLGVPAGVS